MTNMFTTMTKFLGGAMSSQQEQPRYKEMSPGPGAEEDIQLDTYNSTILKNSYGYN